ncbi:uncharacterized protein LOC117336558 [Pecten maximus]|uniref:uncharacterized protein LOC117336558 n=1 Tax=Pecten maximus TaxID=6579 RepID=UPI001458C846|nr:uncharacterized protein LOC117336558 [Pecten maximus]
MKKDILLSRLTTFSDKSEFFDIWKTTFKSVMSELGVTPLEEMDLLVKWLGPESSRHALSIRAAHSNNPQRGLYCIWERLEERYASPEMVEASLKAKLAAFPKLSTRDNKKLYDLCDIVTEVEAVKNNVKYRNLLAYFDSSSGVIPIVNKLPHSIQEKWTNEAVKFKRRSGVSYPPFSVFADFMRNIARVKNDPSFLYENNTTNTSFKTKKEGDLHKRSDTFVSSRKTGLDPVVPQKVDTQLCPVHKTNHTLNKCRAFRQKAVSERKEFLLANGLCFKCCGPTSHLAKNCREVVSCDLCKSNRHATAMHVDSTPSISNHGGEGEKKGDSVNSSCTQICGKTGVGGKSCAKTLLLRVYPEGKPDSSLLTYAIIDDQSNCSLASTKFFDFFNESGEEIEYTLSSCSGYTTSSGRRATGYMIQSLDETTELALPRLIECNQIPNIREEIPTPDIARNYRHLQDIEKYIPPVEPAADITLLIGRDLLAAHYVLDQRVGPHNSPYAQKLNLGWVIIGEVCLGKVHKPEILNVNKTHVLKDGRTTIMKPCTSEFKLCDTDSSIGDFVFLQTKQDNKPGPSIEDRQFLTIMDAEVAKGPTGKWIAPLPFRKDRPRLPNNCPQASHRANILDRNLRKNPTKMQHMLDFMKKVFDTGHAELAPTLGEGEERWYLPLFGVYNPKKPNQIRGVFDSSAKYEGLSLNNVLLTGPDLTNSLLSILIRFRRGNIAITGDIEQMFHCFNVREDHRNFLRFIWYENNDPSLPITEYRMSVQVFGNGPSPAVATFGLRKSVENADEDIKSFVTKNFYVDDRLLSTSSAHKAVDLMKRTQTALWDGGRLRLHKIASNSKVVLAEFPPDDLAKGIKDLDLSIDTPPTQRSLGLSWNLSMDAFTFQITTELKPFTRRGILSTVTSLYDSIGFIAPVAVRVKLLLRDLMSTSSDWDDPLPAEKEVEWCAWRDSLKSLESVHIERCYSDILPDEVTRRELHVFSDASKEAIAAVSYLKIFDVTGRNHVSFVLGKAKVAPSHGHTIPRLELCAAVLAVELAQRVQEHLDLPLDRVEYYTDSRIVLGYVSNERRRFYVYVGNRVDHIRHLSDPDQWHHVPTDLNPADLGTRSVSAGNIQHSIWLKGPSFIREELHDPAEYPLISHDQDKEIRPDATVCKTTVSPQNCLGTIRFERFSSWNKLVESIAHLQHLASAFQEASGTCKGWHQCSEYRSVEARHKAELLILREVQKEHYGQELKCLSEGNSLPRNSKILPLHPILDKDGILRVGGRLNKAKDRLRRTTSTPSSSQNLMFHLSL